MLRPTLKTLALFVLLCAPCAAAPGDEAGEVPFKFEKGYVVVAGTIKGREPVEFIVSTGAERSTADFSVARKYELQGYYTGVPPVTGSSSDRIVSYTKVPDVRVGPVGASLDMFDGSTAEASKALGREIFGALGCDFFRGRTLQLDFGRRVMRFLDKASAEALRARAAGAAGAAVLEMTEREDLLRRPVKLPLVGKVTFDGKPARVMLDTGVPAVVALTSSAAKRLGLEAPPEKGAPRAGTVGSLELGGVKLSGVPVVVFPKGSPAEARLGEQGALAGSAFLQNFVVTFDFRGRGVVVLEQL